MRRFSSSGYRFALGPGPMTPAVKALVIANVIVYLISSVLPQSLNSELIRYFGLIPLAVVSQFWLWQPVTYMFLHGGLLHILFNMLALWMFGTDLERTWGTRFFTRYYFVTGIGAAALTVLVGLLPFAFGERVYYSVTIGASGAIYGLLLAYGLYFPDRPIYVYAIFPIPAKYFVIIFGAIAFLSSVSETGSGTAHAAHLGGLLVGYLYLKGQSGRLSPFAEVKYRYLKWKMSRLRRRFDVYTGGRPDHWDRKVH